MRQTSKIHDPQEDDAGTKCIYSHGLSMRQPRSAVHLMHTKYMANWHVQPMRMYGSHLAAHSDCT